MSENTIEQLNLLELQKDFENSSDIVFKTKSFNNEEKTLHFIKFMYCPYLVETQFIKNVLPDIFEVVKKEGTLNFELINTVVETFKVTLNVKIVLNQTFKR